MDLKVYAILILHVFVKNWVLIKFCKKILILKCKIFKLGFFLH